MEEARHSEETNVEPGLVKKVSTTPWAWSSLEHGWAPGLRPERDYDAMFLASREYNPSVVLHITLSHQRDPARGFVVEASLSVSYRYMVQFDLLFC